MTPTPTPAPPMPMHAMPAPMSFAAAGSMFLLLEKKDERREGRNLPGRLVSRMKGVVEIDAGQDRKHIGLQERDQDFEGIDRDRQRQRRHAADPADGPERDAEQRDEAREHLQRDVAGQHVGEQTHAVRNRAQEEREDLDEDDQRQDVDRDARWDEE